MSKRKDADFLKLARARFDQGQEADKNQLQRELDDIEFYNGEQWPADIRAARAGQNASNGLPPVPARPCITINKVRQPVRQVLNQERQADMGIEIAPADDFADVDGAQPIDPTEIELREGLVRRIQRESQAKDARTWAFARAVQAGRGYYGVMTRFVKQSTVGKPDPSWWDQEVYVQRFYNQSAVTLDPAHEQPDGSDAEWAFVGTWIPYDDYIAQFPNAKKELQGDSDDMSDTTFQALGETYPAWFKEEGPQNKRTKMCRVVDYYYTDRASRKLAWMPDGNVMWADDVPEGMPIQDTREVIQKSIKWAKIDACQVLEETDWPGQFIPIIKVVGEELQPHDAERRSEGMVRPGREANQGLNFMVSKWVEMIGLAPLTPLMVEEGQVEGYEEWYNQANTRTLPYLPFKMTNLDGSKAAAPPFPAPREVPIAPVAASVQMFDEAVKDTTGVPASSLGDTDPTLKSGKAINAVLQQSRQGTSNYLDNLARSIRYEGLIVNDLLYPIYNREGRLARIINGQGEAQTILINAPFTVQGEGKFKRPVRYNAQAQGMQPGQQQTQGPQPQPKTYKLTKDANFNVAVKVTQNFDTRREQIVAMLSDMFSANPELMSIYGDIYFMNLDAPGAKQMADRAKAVLAPPIQKLLEGEQNGQAWNPADQIKIEQAGQMIEELSQKLQEAQQAIATDQAKQQAELQKAQMAAQVDVQKAQIDNQTKLQIAEMNAQVELQIAAAKVQAENARTLAEAETKAALQDDQQRHLHAEAALDRHHEAEKAEQQARVQAAMGERQHEQGLEAGNVAHEQAETSAERAAERESDSPEAE